MGASYRPSGHRSSVGSGILSRNPEREAASSLIARADAAAGGLRTSITDAQGLSDAAERERAARAQAAAAAPAGVATAPNKPRLLDQVRAKLRVLHYSIRTEEAYVN